MISPIFEKLSEEFKDVTFLKVDVDELEDVSAEQGISAMPTFMMYKDGKKVSELVGASEAKLKEFVSKAH
jgi:thioredoxin 1